VTATSAPEGLIGVLGGTFDPVHHGHLRLALEMREALELDQVLLVPAARPPHRSPPVAPATERLAMLLAAVEGVPGLRVDERELDRSGPSYTVDTLRSLRSERPGWALCLLLGMDAFAGLHTWSRWAELPRLAHLGIARRPGSQEPELPELARLLTQARVAQPAGLRRGFAGGVAVADVPALDISSTRIRGLLAAGRDPRYLLPAPVLELITRRGLYIAKP
jgi:nicotinate-nucleotide adenylyltransferase